MINLDLLFDALILFKVACKSIARLSIAAVAAISTVVIVIFALNATSLHPRSYQIDLSIQSNQVKFEACYKCVVVVVVALKN